MIKTILILIGFVQVMAVIGAFSSALGRASVINKWKFPDIFWFKTLEKFFVKILTNSKNNDS